jgi:hypothetical protein
MKTAFFIWGKCNDQSVRLFSSGTNVMTSLVIVFGSFLGPKNWQLKNVLLRFFCAHKLLYFESNLPYVFVAYLCQNDYKLITLPLVKNIKNASFIFVEN